MEPQEAIQKSKKQDSPKNVYVNDDQNKLYNFLSKRPREVGKTAMQGIQDRAQFLRNGNRPMVFARNKHSNGQGKKLQLRQMKKLVRHSHELLCDVSSAFSLFPDGIRMDRSTITITQRTFFWNSSSTSIRIEDILNVSADVGPLFGSLRIATRVYNSIDHYGIERLWRKDAIALKHMIQGYVVARHNDIDTDHLSTKELVDLLSELGNEEDKSR